MIIEFKGNATQKQIDDVVGKLKDWETASGKKWDIVPTRGKSVEVMAIVGDVAEVSEELSSYISDLPGVDSIKIISKEYKLVSRAGHPEFNGGTMPINVSGVTIGGDKLVIVTGPCTVYSLDQTLELAYAALDAREKLPTELRENVQLMFRGGAWKPRKSPWTFQGLGEEGLYILSEVRKQTGLPIVTELITTLEVKHDGELINHLELFKKYDIDMPQIGMRNGRNQILIGSAATYLGKPILLKRAADAKLTEWLLMAEYAAERTPLTPYPTVMCERGINPLDTAYARNQLDLAVIPALAKETYLPIAADPSHGYGKRNMVIPGAVAGVSFGANVLLVETTRGEQDMRTTDYDQSLFPNQLEQLMRRTSEAHLSKLEMKVR